MAALIGGAALFLHFRQKQTPSAVAQTAVIAANVSKVPKTGDYALSNSVTIVLGANEQSHGLKARCRSKGRGDNRGII